VDWVLLKAQAKIESQFKPTAVSPVGAMGLTQFMPATWKEWSVKTGMAGDPDPFNPEHSIAAQSMYMKWLLAYLGDNIEHSLAAYNWGIGNVKKALKKRNGNWRASAPHETKNYVTMILTLHRGYMRKQAA
jgi:soluble lytic murein transglycosylase-like protein